MIFFALRRHVPENNLVDMEDELAKLLYRSVLNEGTLEPFNMILIFSRVYFCYDNYSNAPMHQVFLQTFKIHVDSIDKLANFLGNILQLLKKKYINLRSIYLQSSQ